MPLPRQRLLQGRHQLRRPGPAAAGALRDLASADDGQIEVDKSRTFQEEMGQWNDPASFVPV